jgi:hypothetical protein
LIPNVDRSRAQRLSWAYVDDGYILNPIHGALRALNGTPNKGCPENKETSRPAGQHAVIIFQQYFT